MGGVRNGLINLVIGLAAFFIFLSSLTVSAQSVSSMLLSETSAPETCRLILDHVGDDDLTEFADIVDDLERGYQKLSDVDWAHAVTIFGSAAQESADAEKAAQILAAHDFSIFSGGGPGAMESANRGAKSVKLVRGELKPRSYGLSIVLPNEQASNPFLDREVKFKNFLTRKHFLYKPRGGFIVAVGGFGTLDEFFGLITLIQTKKIKDAPPVVLLGADHYKGLVKWIRTTLVNNHVIAPHDPDLFYVAHSPEEAAQIIIEHNKRSDLALTRP